MPLLRYVMEAGRCLDSLWHSCPEIPRCLWWCVTKAWVAKWHNDTLGREISRKGSGAFGNPRLWQGNDHKRVLHVSLRQELLFWMVSLSTQDILAPCSLARTLYWTNTPETCPQSQGRGCHRVLLPSLQCCWNRSRGFFTHTNYAVV